MCYTRRARRLAITATALAASVSAGCTAESGDDGPRLPEAEPEWSSPADPESYAEVMATEANVFALASGEPLHGKGKVDIDVLDADTGKRRWSLKQNDSTRYWFDDTSITAFSSADDGQLKVYDTKNGDKRFTYPKNANDDPRSLEDDLTVISAAVAADTMVLAERTYRLDDEEHELVHVDSLVGLDASSGEELWRKKLKDESARLEIVAPTPVPRLSGTELPESRDVQLTPRVPVVYVSTSYDSADPAKTVAIDTTNGKQRWEPDELMDLHDTSDDYTLLALEDGRILSISRSWPHGCDNVTMELADPDTGETATATTAAFQNDYSSWQCPRDIFLPRHDAVVLGHVGKYRPQLIDLATGKAQWTADEKANLLLCRDDVAIYDIPDDSIGDGTRAVDPGTGKRLWDSGSNAPNDYPFFSFIDEKHVFSDDGEEVAAMDPRSGDGKWRIDGTLVGANANHYFVNDGKKLHAVPHDGGM